MKMFWQGWKDRRRVRVTAHRANAPQEGGPPITLLFINVTNLGPRDLEITHAWVATSPPLCLDNPHRPLPRRLSDQECWTTWVGPIDPTIGETLAMVRLSTGVVVAAKKETTMPPAGSVAGERGSIVAMRR